MWFDRGSHGEFGPLRGQLNMPQGLCLGMDDEVIVVGACASIRNSTLSVLGFLVGRFIEFVIVFAYLVCTHELGC